MYGNSLANDEVAGISVAVMLIIIMIVVCLFITYFERNNIKMDARRGSMNLKKAKRTISTSLKRMTDDPDREEDDEEEEVIRDLEAEEQAELDRVRTIKEREHLQG